MTVTPMKLIQFAPNGSLVWFDGEKAPYRIRCRSERYIICTKPYNPQRTVLYCIVDLYHWIRGPENLVFGFGAETDEQCFEMLQRVMGVVPHQETQISRRHYAPLSVVRVENAYCFKPHIEFINAVPERIQLSRKKGWRMPANTVKVDRSTPWGNPFVVGVHGDRTRCIELFRALCGGNLCISVDPDCVIKQQTFMRRFELYGVKHLRGKNLACWCHVGSPCHADILIQLLNTRVDRQPSAEES